MGSDVSIAIMIIGLLLFGGCLGVADESDQQPGYLQSSLEYHENEQYVVNGTITLTLVEDETAVFNDVMTCLYNRSGAVIDSTNIGSLKAEVDSANVTLSTERRPLYLIVDHPGFQQYDDFNELVIKWTEETIRPESLRNIDEFEYHSPGEPGECGSTG